MTFDITELELYGVEVGQKYKRFSWYAKAPFTHERIGDIIEVEEIVPYTLSESNDRIAHARCRYLTGKREGDGIQIACRAVYDNWSLTDEEISNHKEPE